MSDFGTRLKELRLAAGLSQEQLANRIHVSKAAISNYELYNRNPSPDILIKLAKIFHVTTDYLLGVEAKRQSIDVTGLSDEDIDYVENTVKMIRRKNLEITKRKTLETR